MRTPAGKLPISWLALLAATISATFLLLTAACAHGEAAGALLPVATESTGDTAPAEQAPAPVSPPEAPEAPAETQGAESAIESAGTAVESAADAPSRVANLSGLDGSPW